MPLWPSTPWLYRGEKERRREERKIMKGVGRKREREMRVGRVGER